MPPEQLPPTVLVVEDEALLLFTLADDLRNCGFTVLEALSADEAIRRLEQHPEISLLFTDVDMPGSMDGVKLSAAVRDRWPPVRIVLTSGKQRPAAEAIPEGGVFIPKPYTTSGVVATMRTMLA